MGSRVRTFRVAIASALVLAGVVLAAPSANAAFHLMKIREVHTGPPGDYVELQMFASGQNFVAGHQIQTYDSTGTPMGLPFTFPGNAANGQNQRTILVGEAAVGPDFIASLDVPAGIGGAVCFEAIDCVSFGAFSGGTPSPAGAPAAPLADGESLERSIAPNCATLLESADDTNNSLADFSLATPSPRSNATPPTETACAGGGNPGGGPDTKIDKGPKKKTKKKRATFEFSSPTPEVSFECSVDGNAPKAFGACTSPFTVRVKKGKHKFEVRAVLNGTPDGSPADYSWKVKKRKRES
jgi:hypothetical protein